MELLELYKSGCYKDAFILGVEEHGKLDLWDDQVLAGRLAHKIGSPRLGSFLHLREGRKKTQDVESQFYYGLALLQRFGPWQTHLFYQSRKALVENSEVAERRLEWLGLQVILLTTFRDFKKAWKSLEKAKSLGGDDGDNGYLASLEARLLESEDKREQALEFLSQEDKSERWQRATLPSRADLLLQLNRSDEALERLQASLPTYESCWLPARIGRILVDREQYAEALECYQEFERRVLLKDKDVQRWLNDRLFDCHYYLGDWDKALEYMGEHPSPVHRKLVENLKKAKPEARRKRLPVKLVRQHHSTCAPATITSIVKFWGHEADHLSIASDICYDGTSASAQRRWAEENGWVTREFTLDWASAVQLIDQDLPFTLTTVELESGHLQAVVGFDERLGTFLLRDPSVGTVVTMLAQEACDLYAFCGPRAMVLAPREEAQKIDLDLPDWELYDLGQEIAHQLEQGNRPRADLVFRQLENKAPEHLQTLHSELALAFYDEDDVTVLRIYQVLAERYPESDRVTLKHYAALRKLNRHQDARDLLQKLTKASGCRAVFRGYLAEEYMEDATQHKKADRLLNRCLMEEPHSPRFYHVLAELRWKQRRFDQALELKFIASCLDDKNEALALNYFQACAQLDSESKGLEFLRERYQKLSEKRSDSGQTLFLGLEYLRRSRDAHELLSALLERFPKDSSLKLFAADHLGRVGQFERAEALLQECALDASELSILKTQAKLESYRGELHKSSQAWEMITKREPTALEAHFGLVATLKALGEGDSAVSHLDNLVGLYPNNLALRKLHYATLKSLDHPEALDALEKILKTDSKDSSAWRKLALLQQENGNLEEADKALEEARKLEPNTSAFYHCLAQLEQKRGRLAEAQRACRQAVEASMPEALASLQMLTSLSVDRKELVQNLDFIWREIEKQKGNLGIALLLYQEQAEALIEPEDLLLKLEGINQGRFLRPEDRLAVLWQTLKARGPREALKASQAATVEFPNCLPLWNHEAEIHSQLGQHDEERRCLERALAIDPTSNSTLRRLSELHSLEGRDDEALEVLQQAVAADPEDSLSQGYLAEVLWAKGERERALETIRKAIRLESGYLWGWQMLVRWSAQVKDNHGAQNLAQELVQTRPKDFSNWLRLFEHLPIDHHQEKLAAIEKALSLAPLNEEVHESKIAYLCELGRHPEALKACRPEVWGDSPPLNLRGRACTLHADMGDVERALKDMNELLLEEPDFFSGLVSVCQWLLSLGREEESYQKALEIQQTFPHVPGAHRMVVSLCQPTNRDPRDALRAVIKLDPTDQEAALDLIAENQQREDYEALKNDLQDLSVILEPGHTLYFRIVLALEEKQESELKEHLATLFTTPDSDQAIKLAVHLCESKGQDKLVLESLRSIGKSAEAQVNAGVMYANILTESDCDLTEALQDLPPGLDFTQGFLAEYVLHMKPKELNSYLKTNSPQLRAHNVSWANVSAQLMDQPNTEKQIVDWTDDWQERTDLSGWMLFNRSNALRGLGRNKEAHELDLWVDTHLEPDHNWYCLKTRLAFDYFESGDFEKSRLNRSLIEPSQVTPYYEILYHLLGAGLAAVLGDFPEARQEMAKAYAVEKPSIWAKPMRENHKTVLLTLKKQAWGFSEKIWCLKQHLLREKIPFTLYTVYTVFILLYFGLRLLR